MSNATANVSFMLLVGQGAHGVAHRMEIVGCKVMVADNAFKVINAAGLAILNKFNQSHTVVEMVEHYQIFI